MLSIGAPQFVLSAFTIALGHTIDKVLLNHRPNHLFRIARPAVTAMHSESKFAKAYSEGVKKAQYWEYTLEDSVDLIAKLPVVAAMIYRNVFKDGSIGVCACVRVWTPFCSFESCMVENRLHSWCELSYLVARREFWDQARRGCLH